MNTSESINEIASALAKAQGMFVTLKKDKSVKVVSEKGTYTYQYADLADVMFMALPKLAVHGICVVQGVSTADNAVTITTRLLHSSGQWIEDCLSLPLSQTGRMNQVQAIGSVITYGRRYHFSAMLGIVSEVDTDTAEIPATKPAPKKKEPPHPPMPSLLTVDELVKKMETAENVFELSARKKKYVADYKALSAEDQLKVRKASDKRKVELTEKAEKKEEPDA